MTDEKAAELLRLDRELDDLYLAFSLAKMPERPKIQKRIQEVKHAMGKQ